VSAREIERNNAIYARQGIEILLLTIPYVSAIWGGTTGGTTDTTVQHCILTSTAKTTSVTLAWNASTDNVGNRI
jgi:hypothetical protein